MSHFTNEKLRHREGKGLSQGHTPEGDRIQAQAPQATSSALLTRPEPGGSLGRRQVLPQGWLSIRECWSHSPSDPTFGCGFSRQRTRVKVSRGKRRPGRAQERPGASSQVSPPRGSHGLDSPAPMHDNTCQAGPARRPRASVSRVLTRLVS